MELPDPEIKKIEHEPEGESTLISKKEDEVVSRVTSEPEYDADLIDAPQFEVEVKCEVTAGLVQTTIPCQLKSKALGKDCIILLLNLITKHKVIMTKSTNATNNKLKEEAWKSIANEFSAQTGEIRRPEQLRLKWENLKKAARKRSAFIRQNNLLKSPGSILPDPTIEDEEFPSIDCNGNSGDLGNGGKGEDTGGHPVVTQVPVNLTDDLVAQSRLSDGTYSCPICRKHIIKKDSIKRHLIKHERPTFPCTYCERVFQQEDLRKKHLATHTGARIYDCDECDKKFKTTSNLSQHKKVVHAKAKLYTCQICTRSFSIHSHLVRHSKGSRCKKPSDTSLECEVCNKIFNKLFLLKSHLRKHSTEKPFQCDICKMDFKYKATLERHIMYIHNGTKNFSCQFCDKSYTHGALLRIHMRSHTGEKPFRCSTCNKLFSHKHNMERHKARHDKPKLTTCTICNKNFPRESRLIYHMRSHTKEKPFPCKVCPKKFTHKQNVIRHYQRKHPNHVYVCTETDASVAKNLWKDIQEQQVRVVKKRIHERNFKKERLLKEKPTAPEVVHIKAEEFEEAINNAESLEIISSGRSRDDSFKAVEVKLENMDDDDDNIDEVSDDDD